jgi:peptide deformylase
MTILEIKTYPDIFLSKPTKQIENIDGNIQHLIENMAAAMYEAPGVGLAAIQVGHDKSLLIYDVAPRNEKRDLQVLINPRIVSSEGTMISEDEGCLSVPDFRSDVKRASQILVEGIDREGKPLRLEAEGLLAVVLQHETDHLNGTLFIDRISSLKRQMYKRRVKKSLKTK